MPLANSPEQTSVLTEKLHQRISRGIAESKPFIDKIETEGKIMNDFIMPLGSNRNVSFSNTDTQVLMNIDSATPGESKIFSMHPHAIYQASDKLGAHPTYIKSLVNSRQAWEIQLAAHALNEHAAHSPRQRVLVREVGNQVRGVLSDQYRRLNSGLIYESFIKSSQQMGGIIYSAFADDTRSWIEVLLPTPIDIPTTKNGILTVAYGIRIATSDFGDGALDMRAFMIQVVCLNGMVRDTILREVHHGNKIHGDIELSNKTYKLDTQTQASFVHDAVKSLLNKEAIVKNVTDIQKASAMTIDLDVEFKKLAKVGLTKGEVTQTKEIITNNRTDDGVQGENTLWKLAQGIGAIARTAEQRRKRELEEISGSLFARINE